MTWFNAYAFTRTGERVVIDMGLPESEAVQRCALEAAFIQSMGDVLFQFGRDWYEPGFLPRVVMYPVAADPFLNRPCAIWLPNSAEL